MNAKTLKDITDLKKKGGELVVLLDEVINLIDKINKSGDKDAYEAMTSEVQLETVNDLVYKLRN